MIENARIGATMLGFGERGVFTFRLVLVGDNWRQTYGNWTLDVAARDRYGQPVGAPWAGPIIAGLLRTVGADSWERLKGAPVRVERERRFGPILRIGHAIEDRWFRVQDYELYFEEDRPLWPDENRVKEE